MNNHNDNEQKRDPLNPDSEQSLFEKLSMDEEDYVALQFIRHAVKKIIKDEHTYGNQHQQGNADK